MSKITILDYLHGVTYVRDFDEDNDTGYELVGSFGLNPGDCEWMITDEFNLNLK